MAKKNKARKKKQGSGSADTSPSALLHRATQLHQAGKLGEAEQKYRQLLGKNPNHVLANYYLGVIALQTGKNEPAEEFLTVAASQDPNNTDILNNLGASLMLQGKTDEATDCFKKALTINPALADTHNNLGKLYRDGGQVEQAIEHYRSALALNPNLFEARRNMGIALRDSGALEQSIAVLQQAAAQRPDDAIARLQLGVSLKEKGSLDKAADTFKQAIELRPNLLDSYIELGNLCHQQEQLDEAVSWFQRALELNPNYAKAHNNLGVVFHEQEEFQPAISHLRRAIAIDPDYAEAANHLGTILIQAGEREEGIRFLRKAIALQPDYAIAHRHLSNACRHKERDADIAAMEELYSAGQITSDQRMHLAFGLAKAYEDLEEYQQAFQYLETGNSLKRKTYNYAISREREVFDAIKQAFAPQANIDEASGIQDHTPIFIIGMPRSGTSLTEQILASHPQVIGAGERLDLWQIACRLCDTLNPTELPGCIANADSELITRLGTEYVESLRRLSDSALHIVDKMPHNFLFLGIIRRALPNAKVIHCERDPVDNCLSIFKNFFVAEHGYAYDLQELGEYYLLYRDLMQFWHERYPGIIHRLSYEAMVEDQEQTTRTLLEYCGLPWDDACLQFHKTDRSVKTASSSQVRRPIYKKSVALWKQYEQGLAPLLEILRNASG